MVMYLGGFAGFRLTLFVLAIILGDIQGMAKPVPLLLLALQ